MNNQSATFTNNIEDYLDTTIIFGEIKKTIVSKDFRGGKVTNIFGSTVLDFTYADLSGVVVLDISQGFGEVKITVPNDWRVETDFSQFCATVDDKRRDLSQTRNSNKILVLTGTSVFAVVDIVNCW